VGGEGWRGNRILCIGGVVWLMANL
jgi:hypothetical protein